MVLYLVLSTAIFAVVLIKIAPYLYKQFQRIAILNKIPGPKSYPVIGMALTILRINRQGMGLVGPGMENRYEWFQNFCKAYYKEGIFRTWLGMTGSVELITAETASVLLSSKNLITKSPMYSFIHPWLGTGLLTSTGDKWHRHRKMITPTFHFNILEEHAVVMNEKAEITKEVINSKLKLSPNEPIDVFVLLTRCALDIICESAMGININAQTDQDSEYSTALHSITIQAVGRIFRPWLFSDFIYYRTSRGKKFKHTVEISHKFTNQVISERRMARKNKQQNLDEDISTDKPKRQAFLDLLLDACERDNTPLTADELREEVDTFMFAGHDTTAAAMSWALFCIGNHPDVEEKIHQEQLKVFGDSTEPATLQQLSELKYLERVMKETLRLFPSAPTISRSVTEDVEIVGYKIPKGTIIGVHIHQIHRDPKYWPEPKKFDPDRFLPENSHGRHPYAYVPFSAGPRNCIGQKFALLEGKIILTAILRTWRVKSHLKHNMAKCYGDLILRPQDGIKIYFTPK